MQEGNEKGCRGLVKEVKEVGKRGEGSEEAGQKCILFLL